VTTSRAFGRTTVVRGVALAAWLVGGPARAQATGPEALPVDFHANDVTFDPRSQAIEARGNVNVDSPPFDLQGDFLRLRRSARGVDVQGPGRVAFCPCLGSPLGVRFDSATLAPPHELILRNPVLEVMGIPVAWLPLFWLRSPGRVGLLTPDLAWRGDDGLFAGGGVHFPLPSGDVSHGLDLRAGGYAEGGVALEGTARTLRTETAIRYDRLRASDGIIVRARAATAIEDPNPSDQSLSWDVDALRGERAVQSTTDVEVAARPFDRLQAAGAWVSGGWTVSSGVRSAAIRGGDISDLGAIGPVLAVRRSAAIGSVGSMDALLEGGEVSEAGVSSTSFARVETGGMVAGTLGALGASLSARGIGAVADDGSRAGTNGAVQARGVVSAPLARGLGPDDRDPWTHTTEPRLEVAALGIRQDDVLPAGRGMVAPSGAVWVAGAGWSNAIGRWQDRDSGEIDVIAGAVGEDSSTRLAVRARASAAGRWAALRADLARVQGSNGSGGALVATARIGDRTGLHATAHVEQRDGVDPVLARALADAPLELASGFLATTGLTGGARLALPVGSRLTARGGADMDIDARQLVAAVGAIELHDPCGCVVVRATAAHRIGRPGVDAWVSIDLPLTRR
jgi:hypothetical protein